MPRRETSDRWLIKLAPRRLNALTLTPDLLRTAFRDALEVTLRAGDPAVDEP